MQQKPGLLNPVCRISRDDSDARTTASWLCVGHGCCLHLDVRAGHGLVLDGRSACIVKAQLRGCCGARLSLLA